MIRSLSHLHLVFTLFTCISCHCFTTTDVTYLFVFTASESSEEPPARFLPSFRLSNIQPKTHATSATTSLCTFFCPGFLIAAYHQTRLITMLKNPLMPPFRSSSHFSPASITRSSLRPLRDSGCSEIHQVFQAATNRAKS